MKSWPEHGYHFFSNTAEQNRFDTLYSIKEAGGYTLVKPRQLARGMSTVQGYGSYWLEWADESTLPRHDYTFPLKDQSLYELMDGFLGFSIPYEACRYQWRMRWRMDEVMDWPVLHEAPYQWQALNDHARRLEKERAWRLDKLPQLRHLRDSIVEMLKTVGQSLLPLFDGVRRVLSVWLLETEYAILNDRPPLSKRECPDTQTEEAISLLYEITVQVWRYFCQGGYFNTADRSMRR
ncbi:MAG: hypothetical protein AAGJ10_02680 [Bacteroidota bacterium]